MSSVEESFPIKFDLTGEDAIVQGSYWRREFAFVQDNGQLWNTAGFAAFMRIRRSLNGSTVIDLHHWQGRILTGIRGTPPYQYNLALELDHTLTLPLTPWGKGVYDLYVRDLSSRWIRVLEGLCELSPTVTPPYA